MALGHDDRLKRENQSVVVVVVVFAAASRRRPLTKDRCGMVLGYFGKPFAKVFKPRVHEV